MEFDSSYIMPLVILYGMCLAAVWLINFDVGETEGYGIFMKIVLSLVLLPIVYFVVNKMGGGQ